MNITLPTDPTEERELARDPRTPAAVLDKIARRPLRDERDGFSREEVASNPNTALDTIIWLSTIQNDSQVINGLLANPATPDSIVRAHMLRDEYARRIVAGRPNIRESLLLEVVEASPWENSVFVSALNNPTLAIWTFNRIAGLRDTRQYSLMIAQAKHARAARSHS